MLEVKRGNSSSTTYARLSKTIEDLLPTAIIILYAGNVQGRTRESIKIYPLDCILNRVGLSVKKDGLWHTILNDIYPSNTYGIYGYACINNSYQTYFPNKFNDGIKVNYENNKSISLVQNTGIIYLDENYKELTEKTAFTGIVNNVKDNYINYTNLLPGVHAKIENLNSKFTLDYEIENLSSINWINHLGRKY